MPQTRGKTETERGARRIGATSHASSYALIAPPNAKLVNDAGEIARHSR